MKVDLGDGSFIDTERPTIRVMAFKKSGKWYASSAGYVDGDKQRLLTIGVHNLADMIKRNDPVIKEFMPITAPYNEFNIVVDAHIPGQIDGFATFMVEC